MAILFHKIKSNNSNVKRLLSLAFPIVVSSLLYSSQGYIDSIMIAKLGTNEIAAVGIGARIMWIINSIIFAFGITMSIFLSQSYGENYNQDKRKHIKIGLALIVSASIILSLPTYIMSEKISAFLSNDKYIISIASMYISYTSVLYIVGAFVIFCDSIFRSLQKPKLSAYTTILEVIINTFLNYCLIFGNLGLPEMGVEGAAIGTIIARLIRAFVSCLLLLILYPELVKPSLEQPIPITVSNIQNYMSHCMPIVGNSLVWIGGVFAYQFFVGIINSEAVVLYAIIVPIESVVISISWGIAAAGGVLIGEVIGMNANYRDNHLSLSENKRVFEVKNSVVLTATIIAGLLSATILLSKPYLIDFYSALSAESALKLERLLTVLALSVFLKTLSMLFISGILVSSGDNKFTFYVSTFSQWCVTVPLCAIAVFVFNANIETLVSLMLVEEVLKLIFSLHRTRGNKWIRSILSEDKRTPF
ncbi:MATE family efflux transporter [Photobacterium leiognathi]|uniref:MATE family efflux transporter n=1 Tax=Photobacterium leiognathi TaxID=553611 RepID=UPI002981211B|nr:MATE family efflux transporter [Photobacterium leiognathi]